MQVVTRNLWEEKLAMQYETILLYAGYAIAGTVTRFLIWQLPLWMRLGIILAELIAIFNIEWRIWVSIARGEAAEKGIIKNEDNHRLPMLDAGAALFGTKIALALFFIGFFLALLLCH